MNPFKKIIFEYCIPLVGRIFRRKNQYVNVIYYHDVVTGEGDSFMTINYDIFKRQMEYIAAKGYETLRFDNLTSDEDMRYSSKKVIIAFDDGWLSNYTQIYDLMKQLNLKYNIYLAVGRIGSDSNYLTWDMVRSMHDSGLVGFGVHTFSHANVADISKVDPHLEFEKANEEFNKQLGYEPEDFCYPYGAYSENSNEYLCSNTIYKRLYTSRLMFSYPQRGKLIMGRNGISNEDPFRVFKAKLKGEYNVWRMIIG